MKMKDLVAVTALFKLARKNPTIDIQFAERPWRPAGSGWNEPIPFREQKGIYVFCGEGDDAPAASSDAEVWYVGKANGADKEPIARRVFAHFGVADDDPSTKHLDLRSRHGWADTAGIHEDYKTAIEHRKCLVYTAATLGDAKDIPEDVENFLLVAIRLFHKINDGSGRAFPLNTM